MSARVVWFVLGLAFSIIWVRFGVGWGFLVVLFGLIGYYIGVAIEGGPEVAALLDPWRR